MKFEHRTNLPALRLAAARKIDLEAEEIRGRYITPGSGQAMAYEQKRREAEAWAANPTIASAEIPHLVAEAEAFDAEIEGVAIEILTLAEQWKQVSAQLEASRLVAKAQLDLATSAAEIRAVETTWSNGLA